MMMDVSPGSIAVIFVSTRTGIDQDGYDQAAKAMEAAAVAQPGYLGIDSVRGADGTGITISYWADEASARAWAENADHRVIQEQARAGWYADYRTIVTRVERSYAWCR